MEVVVSSANDLKTSNVENEIFYQTRSENAIVAVFEIEL